MPPSYDSSGPRPDIDSIFRNLIGDISARYGGDGEIKGVRTYYGNRLKDGQLTLAEGIDFEPNKGFWSRLVELPIPNLLWSQLSDLRDSCREAGEAGEIAELVSALATRTPRIRETVDGEFELEYQDSQHTYGHTPVTVKVTYRPDISRGVAVWRELQDLGSHYRRALQLAIQLANEGETDPKTLVKKVQESL